MIPGNARHTPPRNHQSRQKRNPVPYPRGGRHIGDGVLPHQQSPSATLTNMAHHERSGSTEYKDHEYLSPLQQHSTQQQQQQPQQQQQQQQQTSDPSLLSVHSAPKDKKKPLFRFGKKKSRSDLSSVSTALSSSVGVAAGGPQPMAATAAINQATTASGAHNNTSMTSLHHHPRKRSNEYEFRQPHPLDASSLDDSTIMSSGQSSQRSPYSSYYNVHGAYGDRKKSGGSYVSRKGKDREKSESSYSSAGRMDSGFRSRDNMELYVDQNFASMEGIVNPDFYAVQPNNNGYAHPTSHSIQPQDSAEPWAPPDSWAVQPAESIPGSDIQSSTLIDDEASEYDGYSLMEPQKYDMPRKNYCIRIFRPDGTFATLQLPLSTSANEIVQRLASKFFMPDLSKLNLMIKRNKLERILQPTERPLQIQKTLLEQMGYSEQDNIEDVGREDNSYLLRYVFGQNMGNTKNEQEADYSEHQHIDLQARNLPTVPIFLYKYAQRIVSLDLSKNLQMEIPVDFIQMCRHLKQLWLANNDYVAIPQSIRFVRGLEHLNISGNRLRDLQHARLEDIPGLKTMRVYNNRLEKLPQSFASFKQLTMLFVSNNAFTTFPEVICEITSLAYLDISFNKIQSFPDEIGNLKNLVRLFAIANRFSGSLPPSFAKLENLQELDIRQNLITELDVLSQLPKLEILFVGYNAVSIVGCEFKSLRQLKMTKNHLTQFNLGGSRRSSEENNQHNSNTITGIPAPIATSYEGAMLTDLDLSSCMLSSLPEDVFLYTPLLEELVLDSNTLNSIPSSIGALRKLLRLSVQSNFLDSLPSEISKLGELKVLDAQKNNLKMLPKEIWLCASLQTLNCSSNLLETFPKPFSAPGVALHLPMAPQPDAVVPPSVVANANDGVLPSPLGGHAGQGMVPGTTGAFRDPSSTMDDNNTMAVSPGSTLQSPPNFNPPSFFASPRNHPPPLSLSLRRLFLGDNRLTNEIWSPLMLFLELRTLNLSFNDLDEIPPEHLCHQHLYELYLSGNHLTSLPADDIEKLSYLRVLAVNGNKLQTLPAEIGKLRKLLVLDVGNNVLKYNIANWPYDWNWNWNLSLKFLNLSGNKRLEIKKMHPEAQGPKEKDLADFSALTRLRMLGLMDITILGVSIPEESSDRRVRTSPSEVNNMAYGIADWLGSNEHLGTWDLVMPRFRNNDDESIFGLFDGRKSSRTGCKLTKFLNDHLTYHVMNELRKLKEDDTVVSALRRSFLSLEKGLGGQIGDEKDSGASAVVCYISGTKLYVANVGDAMAVISRNNGQAYEITHKHISLNPSEISRIRAAGGYVSNTGKLNGELKVSRGFGYFDLIPVVNANPYVATIELSENDEFVIMASRGLWERMNYQTAVDVARTEKDDLMAAAQKLRDFAITYGAEKDLMVMVIGVGDLFDKRDKRFRFLRGPGRGAAGADAAGILLDDVSLGPAGLLGGKNKRRGKEEGPGDSTLARLDREVPPPINQVALVFTDIKSSTLLWETQPESMRSAIKIHDAVMRRTLRSVGGYEVKTEGDAFMVCFQNITSALLWCFTVQLQLLDADWPAGILSTAEGREITDQESGQVIYRGLSVRMGVHWGTPVFERNPITSRMDYFGPVVNKASRICNAADGGQICVSSDVVAALRNFPGVLDDNTLGMDDLPTSANNYLISRDIQQLKRLGFHVMELGVRRLKGLETPEMLSLVYPKQLAGRMELEEQNALMEENTNANNATSTAAGTPGTTGGTTTPAATSTRGNKSPSASPRLLATAETSRTTSPHPIEEDIEEEMEVESKDEVEPEDPAVKVVEDSFAKRLPRPSTMSFKPSNSSAGIMNNRAIDPNLVCSLSSLAIRLERLTTGNKQRTTSKNTTMNKMIERHIMYDANDEELMTLMENFVTRVENAVSTLYLHKVGHFANVLEKLGEAIEVDSMHILRALQMYSDVAGLTESPAGLAPL